MDSHQQIEDRAAAFLAKRDSGHWSSEDQAALTRWMSQSTAHQVAFLRLDAVWEGARRLKALSAGLPSGTVAPTDAWRQSPFFDRRPATAGKSSGLSQRRARYVAIAASVLTAVGVASYFSLSGTGERFVTPIGGLSSVPLKDGSSITLNTSSKVRVSLTPQERHIELEAGEAFFNVAKDPTRPFVVQAGNKRVIAVGTQFSVSRDGKNVRVVVTEGAVRLETDGTAFHIEHSNVGTPASMSGSAAIPLEAGAIARAADEDLTVHTASIAQAEEALSWRQGFLTFHEIPLREAIDEFNKYNQHKMSVEDPDVASIRISGTFRPSNYQGFLRLLEGGFSIHVRNTEDVTVLSRN